MLGRGDARGGSQRATALRVDAVKAERTVMTERDTMLKDSGDGIVRLGQSPSVRKGYHHTRKCIESTLRTDQRGLSLSTGRCCQS